MDFKLVGRLLKHSVRDFNTGCLNWNGAIYKNGYGMIRYKKHTTYVHRLAAYLWLDFDLNSDLCVCHKCDNRKCIERTHLFIGTRSDNMKDMINKGRGYKGLRPWVLKGSCLPQSKLDEDDVVEIRNYFNKKEFNVKDLSEIFKVHCKTVKDIIENKTWKHI